MKTVLLLICSFGAFAQQDVPRVDAIGSADAPAPSPILPVGVAAFGEFNQLGTPRWTMGVAAIYPVAGSVGVYGTTVTDILPKKAMDPATGRNFYALSTSVRQGVHKSLMTRGPMTFLVGGDVGPAFSSTAPASGINVNLSSSFVATAVYRISPSFGVIFPIRMLYVSGIGWNPVAQAGVVINLSKAK